MSRGGVAYVVTVTGIVAAFWVLVLGYLAERPLPEKGVLTVALSIFGLMFIALHKWLAASLIRRAASDSRLIARFWHGVGERAVQVSYLVIGFEFLAAAVLFLRLG